MHQNADESSPEAPLEEQGES